MLPNKSNIWPNRIASKEVATVLQNTEKVVALQPVKKW